MTTPQPDRHTQKANFTPKRVADEDGDARSLRPSILFLGLALCLTLGIAAWLGLVDTNDDIRLEITDVSTSSDGNVALTGARYRGHTESGKRFEVIATAAIERSDSPGNIDLSEPIATIFSDDGSTLNITSQTGAYSQTGSGVALRGNVIVTDSGRGMTMETEMLDANLSSGNLHTNTDVRLTSDTALVLAEGMQVFDEGDLIVFRGKSKMTLHNAAAND
jgi:LPS export ABC transporter protein LptC